MKYYMVYDQDKVIWGIGRSKSEARKDAHISIKDMLDPSPPKYILKSIECSEELFYFIQRTGHAQVQWKILEGQAMLQKRVEVEMFSLLSEKEKLNKIYELLLEERS